MRSRQGLTHLSRHPHDACNSAAHLMGSQHISVELNSPLRGPIHSHPLSVTKRTDGDKCWARVSQQPGVSLSEEVSVVWSADILRGAKGTVDVVLKSALGVSSGEKRVFPFY